MAYQIDQLTTKQLIEVFADSDYSLKCEYSRFLREGVYQIVFEGEEGWELANVYVFETAQGLRGEF